MVVLGVGRAVVEYELCVDPRISLADERGPWLVKVEDGVFSGR